MNSAEVRKNCIRELPKDLSDEQEDEAIELLCNIVATDRTDKQGGAMFDVYEDWAYRADALSIIPMIVEGDIKGLRNFLFEFIADKAVENCSRRGPTDEEREREDKLKDSPEWSMREVGPINR